MPRRPELREELLDRVERELAAADAFFGEVEADAQRSKELDRRLAGPTTPLLVALDGWEDAPPAAETLLSLNTDNAERLDAILADGPWPGLRDVGADGADAAWMLAQHADRVNERRHRWLALLAEAVAAGDADPRHLAALTDRVAAVDGSPQTYGTIAILASDGEVEHPLPVRDPGDLDTRRASIGLASMADEARHLGDGDLVPYGPDRGTNPVNQWPIVLEGHVSVEAALEGGMRHVHRVWAVRPGDRRLGRLRALARERGVTIEAVGGDLIDEVATGRTHGGVVALVGPAPRRSVASLAAEAGEGALLVMLDGIEDPFNYGQALRALYAAGVDGVITRRSWETATTTVARASAGASELLPTAVADGPADAAAICRRAGLRVACAVADQSAVPMSQADLRGGWFVLIGGERRGITRSFVDDADLVFRIPYGRQRAPALGAAVSAALVAFEALRQRDEAAGSPAAVS